MTDFLPQAGSGRPRGLGPDERGSRQAPLSGEEVVFLSHQRWNTHFTSVHSIALRLARSNRVLFMEPPDSAGWLLHEPPAREALMWALGPLERKKDNLYIYHTPPFFLPGQARARWIARSVSATFEYMVRGAIAHLGFRRPIYWVFQFNTVWVLRSLRARLVVYECAEEWAEYETRPSVRQYVRAMDERLCRRADVVIVPSKKMLDRKSPYNPRTHLVPWGVDVGLYAQARSPETPVPADMASIPHPIIGMFGMLDGRRLNNELITRIAGRHPEWQFVLVGRCMPNLDTAPLRAFRNIHLLGMKPVDQLPGYCKAFDVCMIPYLINSFTHSIMPLKLVEYLPTGKPVVTTALPAAEDLRDVLYVADGIDDFERLLLQAMAEGPERMAARLLRAAEYDWEVLADRKMRFVAERMSSVQDGAAGPASRLEGAT